MESFEQMRSRHSKEQKDLQARITQKKKGATKKTRKGVNDECDELERRLREQQDLERAALDRSNGQADAEAETAVPGIDDVPDLVPGAGSTEDSQSPMDSAAAAGTGPTGDGQQPRKRNRQKERLARRAAGQDAAVEQAKLEAANQPDAKAIEHAKLQAEFKSHGRVEKFIRPDGHCLFSAVADQLQQAGIPLTVGVGGDTDVKVDERYKVVRSAAARYIEGHPDDFVAWLDEPLGTYVEKIRDTAEWGGHLELLALARTYNVEIRVLQDGGAQTIQPGSETEAAPRTQGQEKAPETIWLAYYRHGFGLGEHYNSLRKAP